MPYAYEWLIDGQVLFSKFEGKLKADEILQASRGAIAHYQDTEHTVHSIIDASGVTGYPIFGWKPLSSRESAEFRKIKNVGWILLVTKNRMIIGASQMIRGVSRLQFKVFATPTEALRFMQAKTSHLDWESAEMGII